MGSLAIQSPATPAELLGPIDVPPQPPPELKDDGYLAEVLHLNAKQSEDDVIDELVAKASALGIPTTSRSSASMKLNLSSADSATTVGTRHARTSSTDSKDSTGTALTSHSSVRGITVIEAPGAVVTRKRSKSLSFAHYEKYICHVDPNLKQPKFVKEGPAQPERPPSIFSVSTRRSYVIIKKSLQDRMRWRKRSTSTAEIPISCICCREDFNKSQALQILPCGHTYCGGCLRTMMNQSSTDESKMPPRCCTQPIPSCTVKVVLSREEQQTFLKAVLQFATPWEARIFCPNSACLEFIPALVRIDPKHPFEVVCHKCQTRVCILCKRHAHPLGQDCPDDWDLDAVLKMGEKSGWRRCYKCRTLVELSQGCTHITCRCKAQFCYICGAIWDNVIGCPNFCNGEEEMERRRVEEENRVAELAAEKAAQEKAAADAEAEKLEAEKRTAASGEFKLMRSEQETEAERFRTFRRKTKRIQLSRHSQKKLAMIDKYSDLTEKMKERHAKTAQHLEDRQIAAEMDLRMALAQSEKSVRIRLKHMEAYCNGQGPSPDGTPPQRVVTERDRRELGQQYNLRDDMDRLHQAKINVMRDRQAKRMEELLERQKGELQKFSDKREEDLEDLAAEFAHDEDALSRVFEDRRTKLERRWELEIEILRREMESKDGVAYGTMDLPDWSAEGGLATVDE